MFEQINLLTQLKVHQSQKLESEIKALNDELAKLKSAIDNLKLEVKHNEKQKATHTKNFYANLKSLKNFNSKLIFELEFDLAKFDYMAEELNDEITLKVTQVDSLTEKLYHLQNNLKTLIVIQEKYKYIIDEFKL